MHGRARILGDQWRRVRTRDIGRKEVNYVCGQICANTNRVTDDIRKCCSNSTGYCSNAAIQFIHVRQNISCKSARRFSVDYARKTLYRLKSSGYQKLDRYIAKLIPFSRPPQYLGRLRKEGVIYNFNYIEDLHLDYLIFLYDLLFLSVTISSAY